MEARRRVQPGVQWTAHHYSICYKKQRRVVEIEIRIETREEHHLLLRGLLLRSIRRPQRPLQPLPPALHLARAIEIWGTHSRDCWQR